MNTLKTDTEMPNGILNQDTGFDFQRRKWKTGRGRNAAEAGAEGVEALLIEFNLTAQKVWTMFNRICII